MLDRPGPPENVARGDPDERAPEKQDVFGGDSVNRVAGGGAAQERDDEELPPGRWSRADRGLPGWAEPAFRRSRKASGSFARARQDAELTGLSAPRSFQRGSESLQTRRFRLHCA